VVICVHRMGIGCFEVVIECLEVVTDGLEVINECLVVEYGSASSPINVTPVHQCVCRVC